MYNKHLELLHAAVADWRPVVCFIPYQGADVFHEEITLLVLKPERYAGISCIVQEFR